MDLLNKTKGEDVSIAEDNETINTNGKDISERMKVSEEFKKED